MAGTFGRLGGIVCIAAGLYLLQGNDAGTVAAGGSTWFQLIAHGIGIYFIGKGIFILSTMSVEGRTHELLSKLIEATALRLTPSEPQPAPAPGIER